MVARKQSGKQKIVVNMPGNLQGRFLHMAIKRMADERDITISMMAYEILADSMDTMEDEFLDRIDASLLDKLKENK
jgi:hypothetical protein